MTELIKLFGKKREQELLSRQAVSGRLPHGIIITGENGIGKKTLALYIACLMMCESPEDGHPCGTCRSCRMTAAKQHPDVIFARGDKYSKDSMRGIVHDSFYMPNDGGLKIFIFTECEELTDEYQNQLLKIIEEPSDSTRYIFTCESPALILDTVMSRLAHMPLEPMSEGECIECLVYNGMDRAQAAAAAAHYGTNPGKALSAEGDSDMTALIDKTDNIAKALAYKDEYEALVLISSASDRKELFALIELLYDTVCRALTGNTAEEGAKELESRLDKKTLYSLSEKLSEYAGQKKLNLAVKTLQCALISELFSIIFEK